MTSVPQQLLIRVLASWFDSNSLGTLEITEISGGLSGALLWKVSTRHGCYCLRRWPPVRSPRDTDLIRIHRFIEHVWDRGFHEIPRPQRTLTQETAVRFDGAVWELSFWLAGNPTRTPTSAQANAAADAVARFHLAGASFYQGFEEPPGLRHRRDVLDDLRAGALHELRAAVGRSGASDIRDVALRVISLVDENLPRASALVLQSHTKVPVQWCLGDSHIENFLFTDDQVTGIVDFATAGVNSVARDIARLLGSMVPHRGNPWQEHIEAYRRNRPLTADEVRLVSAFHISGTIGAAANWLRWRFIEDLHQADAATTRSRLIDLEARLESVGNATEALSALCRPNR